MYARGSPPHHTLPPPPPPPPFHGSYTAGGQLYNQLHHALYSSLHNSLYSELFRHFYNELYDQLHRELYSQLDTQHRHRRYNQFDNRQYNQLYNQFDNQQYNQRYHQFDSQQYTQFPIPAASPLVESARNAQLQPTEPAATQNRTVQAPGYTNPNTTSDRGHQSVYSGSRAHQAPFGGTNRFRVDDGHLSNQDVGFNQQPAATHRNGTRIIESTEEQSQERQAARRNAPTIAHGSGHSYANDLVEQGSIHLGSSQTLGTPSDYHAGQGAVTGSGLPSVNAIGESSGTPICTQSHSLVNLDGSQGYTQMRGRRSIPQSSLSGTSAKRKDADINRRKARAEPQEEEARTLGTDHTFPGTIQSRGLTRTRSLPIKLSPSASVGSESEEPVEDAVESSSEGREDSVESPVLVEDLATPSTEEVENPTEQAKGEDAAEPPSMRVEDSAEQAGAQGEDLVEPAAAAAAAAQVENSAAPAAG